VVSTTPGERGTRTMGGYSPLPGAPQAHSLKPALSSSGRRIDAKAAEIISSALCHANRFSLQGEQLSRRMCHTSGPVVRCLGGPSKENGGDTMQQHRIPLARKIGPEVASGQGSDWVRGQPFPDLCWETSEFR
jgi:hypothetical protein